MNTRVAFTLTFLLALGFCWSVSSLMWSTAQAPPHVPTSIEQALKTAYVTTADEGQASCSPIAEAFACTVWLTCDHVVTASPVTIRVNGVDVPVLATSRHPTKDIGLIWTDRQAVQPIPLATKDAAPGSTAVHAGYPVELGLWLSQGLMGSPDEDGDVWTSVPLFYGCSGGPVLVDGKLVGVGMGIYAKHQGPFVVPVSTISCIIPVDSFRDWLTDSLSRDPRAK